MNAYYQRHDAHLYDYKLFRQFGIKLRGPAWAPDDSADLNIVGSARVFGRYQARTVTDFLAERHGLLARNIAFGACVPRTLALNEALIAYLNRGVATNVLQLCGGDGSSCDWMTAVRPRGTALEVETVAADGRGLAAILKPFDNLARYAAFHGLDGQEVERKLASGDALPLTLPAGIALRGYQAFELAMRGRSRAEALEQLGRCGEAIVADYRALREAIATPLHLLYFAARPPLARTADNLEPIVKTFPHLIDEETWTRLVSLFDSTIIVTSRAGYPFERKMANGAVKRIGVYPSEEMHRDCADAIAAWHAGARRRSA